MNKTESSELKWMYNFGESEVWLNHEFFDTKLDAIEAGLSDDDFLDHQLYGENLFVAQMGEYPVPEDYVNIDHLIEGIQESIGDEYGEVAQEYLDEVYTNKPSTNEMYNDLEERIKNTLGGWLDKYNLRPRFSNLINIEQITHWKGEGED